MACPRTVSFFLSGLAVLVIVNSSRVFAESSQVFDIEATNITATSMILTWKINDSCSVYTYKIHIEPASVNLNLTINETQAVITGLSSSTLYNITVGPFLQNSSAGMPGFLQVYTRECTHC